MEIEKDKYKFTKNGDPLPELKILSTFIIDTQNDDILEFKIKWGNVRDEFKFDQIYDVQKQMKNG